MSKKYDIAYAFPTTKEGEKPRWITCGAVFETAKGPRLKIDCIPVGFNGWFAMFEPKPKEQRQTQPAKPASDGAPFDDDIGF